jgi:taurine dioxygenase
LLTTYQLTPAIGAEISGVDLSRPLSGETLDELYDLLMAHQVIFLRDQELTPSRHIELAHSFGTPEPPHPVYRNVEGFEQITVLANGPKKPPSTDGWHTDVTFKVDPPFSSILYAKEIPPVGGDTLWLSMTAAYQALPEGMKSDLEGVRAVHDLGDFVNNFATGDAQTSHEQLTAAHQKFGSAVHPIVQSHPITGKRYLYVNPCFCRHVVGVKARESNRLLEYLYDHIYKPDYQVRFKWTKNSVAMWDNRCTQHYATGDYLPHTRLMHRVTIADDRRVSEKPENRPK